LQGENKMSRRFGSETFGNSGFNPQIYRVVVHGREVDLSESAVNYYRSIGVEVGTPKEIIPNTTVITEPVADQGWNPVADLTEWLTGGIDVHINQPIEEISTNLQNQAENILPTFNQGLQQANTWIDQNFPDIMQEITDHTSNVQKSFIDWAKNEELKQQKTWEEFAEAFGSGTGNISTLLTGGGIGFVIAIIVLVIFMVKGK
jgi:predicted PurR-regulated permease PerM